MAAASHKLSCQGPKLVGDAQRSAWCEPEAPESISSLHLPRFELMPDGRMTPTRETRGLEECLVAEGRCEPECDWCEWCDYEGAN